MVRATLIKVIWEIFAEVIQMKLSRWADRGAWTFLSGNVDVKCIFHERKLISYTTPTMSFWKMINFIIPACRCFIHFISLQTFFKPLNRMKKEKWKGFLSHALALLNSSRGAFPEWIFMRFMGASTGVIRKQGKVSTSWWFQCKISFRFRWRWMEKYLYNVYSTCN